MTALEKKMVQIETGMAGLHGEFKTLKSVVIGLYWPIIAGVIVEVVHLFWKG